jgi:hypothetical protein
MLQPVFERRLVEDRRSDGYFIEALDVSGDGKPDLVAYGLGAGEVNWYANPTWAKQQIMTLPGPVGMHHADVNNNGRNDVIVCYQYGMTMVDCDPTGGKIVWLENPGASGGIWQSHYIGRATSMHRLRVGHFTRTDRLQVLALPIVGQPNDLHSVTPIMLFTQPDDVAGAAEWVGEEVRAVNDGMPADPPIDRSFHVIHGVSVKPFEESFGSHLDSALIASEEGITWLHFVESEGRWHAGAIGSGELTEVSRTGFRGSGDVDAGKVGDHHLAYIAAVEPFHGNTVVAYVRDSGERAPRNTDSLDGPWKRVVLDVFGDPNPLGEGPGHFVVCGDFDRDGDDEFLVALRGPMPWQGVFYYKAVDVANGVFVKWRVSEDSAARIAVADFDGDGQLDFATVGYSVGGYYCAENPAVVVYLNRFVPA